MKRCCTNLNMWYFNLPSVCQKIGIRELLLAKGPSVPCYTTPRVGMTAFLPSPDFSNLVESGKQSGSKYIVEIPRLKWLKYIYKAGGKRHQALCTKGTTLRCPLYCWQRNVSHYISTKRRRSVKINRVESRMDLELHFT